MRILDRYVLTNFLKNYMISLFVLIGMYVVLDMVFNLDNFVSNDATSGGFAALMQTAAAIIDYYFYQCFLIFVHLSGVIPVVAAAFTFIRLSRNNELTALLAAGVPLLRVATPIIVIAVLLNGLVLVDTELVIPHMIPKLTRKHDDVLENLAGTRPFPVRNVWDNRRNLVTATTYTPARKHAPPTIQNLDVILRDADLKQIGRLDAQSAVWDDDAKKWMLTEGWTVMNSQPGKKSIPLPTHEYEGLTPKQIASAHDRNTKSFMIRAMEDQDANLFCATKYMPAWENSPPTIEYLDVIYRDAKTLDPISHLTADRAIWNQQQQQWDLINGRLVRGLLLGQPTRIDPHQQIAYASNITPDEIGLYRSREFVELLPTSRINEILSRPKNYGTLDLLRVKHFRFTQPLINIVLLLLAIPCVLLREPGKLRLATMQCLVLVGACMGCAFLAQQIAGTPPASAAMRANWPAMMAWMPIFAFGPMSIMLMERVKS